MRLSEATIQNGLYDWLLRRGCHLACPNYTPAQWWECDLWAVSESGYATEYEIKLSVSDFAKDATKVRLPIRRSHTGTDSRLKHQELENRSVKGPKRFFYVTPRGLLPPDRIPEWAGLIEVSVYRRRVLPVVVKDAPVLHTQKVDSKVIEHCKSVFYYRYWSLRQRHFAPSAR